MKARSNVDHVENFIKHLQAASYYLYKLADSCNNLLLYLLFIATVDTKSSISTYIVSTQFKTIIILISLNSYQTFRAIRVFYLSMAKLRTYC